MNFLNAVVLKRGDQFAIKIGELIMMLPNKVSESNLENYVDKEVVIGVRPENIHIEDAFVGISSSFKVKVDFVELTGSDLYLHFSFAGHRVISRVNSRNSVKKGEDVELSMDVNRIHIFDRDTEMAVYH